MTDLLYFILGIVFCMVLMPLLDSFISLVCMRMELTKGKYQIQMMKFQKELDDDEFEKAPAIGFDTSCYICRDDEEEEPEEEEE